MGKILIIPDTPKSRSSYMENHRLPAFYMGDFSVLGLLVAPYGEAVRILDEKGYPVRENGCGADVGITGPAQVAEIRRLLHESGIGAEMADIVAAVYQA